MSSGDEIGRRGEEPAGAPPEGEEPSGGTLAPSPELEAALREAEAAVAGPGRPAAGESAEAAEQGAEALARLTAERDELHGRLLRVTADLENFRRRALKERSEVLQYGHQNLVKDLLSTVDNLERASEHARKSGGADLENLLQGVELVRRQLWATLTKHGVTVIEALGQPFDPGLHEAIAQVPSETAAPNTVLEELEKGYRLRDRLLRPARVVVATAPETRSAATAGEDEGGAAD
jgi:molecular chaperone GrpE